MAKTQIAQINTLAGWIDFGIGQPQTDLLPLEYLAKAATHQFNLSDNSILQYGIQQGNGFLRTSLSEFLSA